MSFTIDRSVSPARSGFGKIFSKSSREKKNRDSAENSLKSNDSDNQGLRASLEDAIEDEVNVIKKLVPTIGSKRRRRQQDELRASEEAARGRSVSERGTLENDTGNAVGDHSGGGGGGDDSNLITYESDVES
jgi:hypothetical protein